MLGAYAVTQAICRRRRAADSYPHNNLSVSTTQQSTKHSPRCRYTRDLLSARNRVNWNSSVNKNRSHCLNENMLEAYAVTQAICRRRRAADSYPHNNLSLSTTQQSTKHSPRCRYTRDLPSARNRVNWNSSINKNRSHCLNKNMLEAYAVTQAIRRRRRAAVRGRPTSGRRAHRPTLRNLFLTVFA